jgi:hypothetical protein
MINHSVGRRPNQADDVFLGGGRVWNEQHRPRKHRSEYPVRPNELVIEQKKKETPKV